MAIGDRPRKGPPLGFAISGFSSGRNGGGSITGFYTVLVEGDDFNEPISDAARSILDGHVMLTRELAAENHYPAIDVLQSISRLMTTVAEREHQERAGYVKEMLAVYTKARDLINIGAYQPGSSAEIDEAIAVMPAIVGFLRQDTAASGFGETVDWLSQLQPPPTPAAPKRSGR